VIINNSTKINKNHLSPQLIEWWSTIPPISTKITSHLNSLSDGQQFYQYQQKSPLTSTHWVMVNNSTNINKNHLSPQLIEWCQQFHRLKWEVICGDIGGIVDHHSLSWSERWFLLILVELLTITQWVKVRGDVCWYWWNCWPHQNQQESSLTSTHWVMVNNSTNINKNHLSPQLIEWWSTILQISTKITSHLNSLSDGQQFHQYQQKSPLASIHWVMVNNSTNINNNHISLQLIEWWSTVIFVDIGGIVDHHSMSWIEGWFLLILVVELLTITQWVEVRGDVCWYWWNCWPSLNELRWEVIFVDIGGIVEHHSMSWSERWFWLILVEVLTITQWV
jgi:hypothetical protein